MHRLFSISLTLSELPLPYFSYMAPSYDPVSHIRAIITVFLIFSATRSFYLISCLISTPTTLMFFISGTLLRYFLYLRHQNPSLSYLGLHYTPISHIYGSPLRYFLYFRHHYSLISHIWPPLHSSFSYLGCCTSYLGRHLHCLHIKIASSARQDTSGACFEDRSRLDLLQPL